MTVTDALLDDLKARVRAKEITDPDALLEALKEDMKEQLAGLDRELHLEPGPDGSPNVWLFVGVNGVARRPPSARSVPSRRPTATVS